MGVQVSIATQGGSGTPTPDISIEVDYIDAALKGVRKEGFPIEYGPVMNHGEYVDSMFAIRLGSS